MSLLRKNFITTALGSAIVSTGSVDAAQGQDQGISLSLTYRDFNVDMDDSFEGGGYASDATDTALEDGDGLGISVTIPVSALWDIRASFSQGDVKGDGRGEVFTPLISGYGECSPVNDESGEYPRNCAYGTYGFDSDQSTVGKSEYQLLDFDAGYRFQLGGTAGRASLGLRYIDLKQSIRTIGNYQGYGFVAPCTQPSAGEPCVVTGPPTYTKYSDTGENVVFNATHEIKALGLRAATEFERPLGAGFSVSGGVGLSILFGERKSKVKGTITCVGSECDAEYGSYSSSSSSTTDDVLPIVDAEIAISYLFAVGERKIKATTGYAYTNYFDLIRIDTLPSGAEPKTDLREQSWFARISGEL